MLRKKQFIEKDRSRFEQLLATLSETLQSEGLTDTQIRRDTRVRHYTGKLREARYRLSCIAKLEEQMTRKVEIKAEKLAAPKVEAPKKRKAADPEKKKAKMVKKQAPVETDEE